jgi:hypothetical protein
MPDDARGYSQKGAHEEKEKDMEIIKDRENAIPVEDRVASLEKKMRDMEALVRGLTEELLDLKSITMRMNKAREEPRPDRSMSKAPTAAAGGQSTVVVPRKPASPPQVRAPAAPVEPEKMDMIMQPDGTLKPEKRQSSDYIVASAGYTKKNKPGQSGGKSSDLIVAEEEESEKK